MTMYFTSDTHFGHKRIIELCNRPFKSASHMDNELAKNWNSVVKNHSDVVYILGDFSMKGKNEESWILRMIKKLKGRKVLILGNHDKLRPFDYVDLGFESVHTSLILGERIMLCHDPAWAVAVPDDWTTLCGHVHDAFKVLSYPRQIINVGVDVWDYKPVTLKQIFERIATTTPESPDGGHRCGFLKEFYEQLKDENTNHQ